MSKYLCSEIDIWAKDLKQVEDIAARLDIPVVSTEVWNNGRCSYRFEVENEALCQDFIDTLNAEGVELL